MIYVQIVAFLAVITVIRDIVRNKAYYTYRNMFFYAVLVFLLVIADLFATSLDSFYEPFFRILLLPVLAHTLGINYILVKSLTTKIKPSDFTWAFIFATPMSILIFLDDKLNFFFKAINLNANGSLMSVEYGIGYYLFLLLMLYYGLIIAYYLMKVDDKTWKKVVIILVGLVLPFLASFAVMYGYIPQDKSPVYMIYVGYFLFIYVTIFKDSRYIQYFDDDEKAIMMSMGAYYVIADESDMIEFVSFDYLISNPEMPASELIGRNYVEVLGEEDFISNDILRIGNKYFEMQVKVLSSGKTLIYYRDFSEIQQSISEREHLVSVTDKLTGLANRVAFEDDFYKGKLAYSFTGIINIRDFSKLNTTYGHNIGNKYLQIQAQRLKIRFGDYITYRLGADEFLIQSPLGIEFDPQEVIDAITDPVEIDGIMHQFGACMGVYDFKSHKLDDINEYISLLDFALRLAKQKGGSSYTMVNSDHIELFKRRKELYLNLLGGLKKDNVIAVFQPYIDIDAGKIVGFEGLARVIIFDRMFFPNEFIHLLEDTEKIKQLDLIVLDKCLEFATELLAKGLFDSTIKISSNLSTLSMERMSIEDITMISDKYNIPRENIELEITEQTLIAEKGYELVKSLKEAGYKIAIDDFSSGYASLKYLANMDADTLKIDRELVVDVDDADSNQAKIYQMILDLADRMGLETVCEGVETIEQFDSLRAVGAKLVQGYFFSKPVSTDKFIELVNDFNSTEELN